MDFYEFIEQDIQRVIETDLTNVYEVSEAGTTLDNLREEVEYRLMECEDVAELKKGAQVLGTLNRVATSLLRNFADSLADMSGHSGENATDELGDLDGESLIQNVEWPEEDCLGKGNCGAVFRYSHHGMDMAVKIWIPGMQPSESFLEEAKAMKRVSFPSVARVFFAERVEERYIIAMELLQTNLYDAVLKGEITDGQILRALLDTANGLSFMQKKYGRIHRDLKPQNILLDKDNRAKITDFGFSVVTNSDGSYEFRGECDRLGTARYLSPEVLTDNHMTYKGDVFSFGMMCYFAMAKKEPFAEISDDNGVVSAILDEKRPSLDGVSMPEDMRDLIERCWDPNPDLRPTYDEIISILEAIIIGETLPGPFAPAGSFWFKNFCQRGFVSEVSAPLFRRAARVASEGKVDTKDNYAWAGLDKEKTVTFEWFVQTVKRYGFWYEDAAASEAFHSLEESLWFNGRSTTETPQCMGMLKSKPAGSFILRHKHDMDGVFVLHMVDKGRICKYLVLARIDADGKMSYGYEKQRETYPTIQEFLKANLGSLEGGVDAKKAISIYD